PVERHPQSEDLPRAEMPVGLLGELFVVGEREERHESYDLTQRRRDAEISAEKNRIKSSLCLSPRLCVSAAKKLLKVLLYSPPETPPTRFDYPSAAQTRPAKRPR